MWRNKTGRLLRVFAPFAILFVGLVILNFRIDDTAFIQRQIVDGPPKGTKQPTEEPTGTPIPINDHQIPVATAIANIVEPSPTPLEPTPTSKPTLIPSEVATLTGPPSESRFSLSSPLSFFWYPAQQIREDQAFALVIVGEGFEELVGLVSEPNLGTGYQVYILPEEFGFSAGNYSWQVRLLQQQGDILIGSSGPRSINFVEAE